MVKNQDLYSFDVALIAQSLHTIYICKLINYKSKVNDIGLYESENQTLRQRLYYQKGGAHLLNRLYTNLKRRSFSLKELKT